MNNLWSFNSPSLFWRCEPEIDDEYWQDAIQKALPILGLPSGPYNIDQLMALILGEEQFGPNQWKLSSVNRIYYAFKPVLPRRLTIILRRLKNILSNNHFLLNWPIEDRYIHFQWEVLKTVLGSINQAAISYRSLWPDEHSYAFVLTHDIESEKGQSFVRSVADLEEQFGFRSSFNFVHERYKVDNKLVDELKARGFEIGLHGDNHDGHLFDSYREFHKRVKNINTYLEELGAVGFRSPLTLRNPEWMQELNIEYDLSFFDTDPCEPIPGGTMSIWPFFLGRFVELPYTLIQDYTLTALLGETSPQLWLDKVDFIEKYHGMALINTHPDYLRDSKNLQIFTEFLNAMRARQGYWHALPREAARWWKERPGITDKSIAKMNGSSLQLSSDISIPESINA